MPLLLLLIFFGLTWVVLLGPANALPFGVVAGGTVVLVAAYVTLPIALVRGHGRRADDRAAVVGDLLLGTVWVLAVWSLIGDLLRLGLTVAGVPNPDRSRLVALVVAVVVVLLLGFGLYSALRVPRVRRTEVVLDRLDPRFDATTVAVVADTHFGPLDRTWWSRRLVSAVNALRADVVVHAGDLVDGSVAQRAGQVAPFAEITAAHRYYITGNHEYLRGAQEWLDHMAGLGWQVLHNEHRLLRRAGASLVIAGVDDRTAAGSGELGHGADLDAALAGAPADAPVLLLSHQPKQVRMAEAAGVDLQISGHTHGGQIWPFHHLVRAEQGVVHGLHRRAGRTQLYVTRGSGFWGPPLRIFAPSEISLLTLRAPAR